MNWSKIIPLVLVAIVIAVWFGMRSVGKAEAGNARQMVADGALLLDVRTPEEFARGHLDGALNIPFDQVAARSKELGALDRPIVVYCQSGGRSAAAASTLAKLGYKTVEDIGPMSRW